jgi:methylenetetrahydrofolate dehydrogenase (NADP+) / methenyltetrahydrofolate cyclohydrolase
METMIFDGRAFAADRERKLKKEVFKLKKKGIVPRLVTFMVGDNTASKLYVDLKKKKAREMGCELLIIWLSETVKKEELIRRIEGYNKDKKVHGIMIQIPLPDNFSIDNREEVINSISKTMDVDGLRKNSPFLTPTVKSVLYALKKAVLVVPLKERICKVVIVGYSGFEGGKIYRVLKEMEYEVDGVDSKTKNLKNKTKNADILISATGQPGLIRKDMIKKGSIVIDVGSPKGDVMKEEVVGKASFLSSVPGGIGPVTIISLLENLVESAESALSRK